MQVCWDTWKRKELFSLIFSIFLVLTLREVGEWVIELASFWYVSGPLFHVHVFFRFCFHVLICLLFVLLFLFSFSSSQFIPLYKLYFLFRAVSSPFKYCRYILFALIKLYCYTVRVILLNLWSFSLSFFSIFYEFHCAVSECLQLFNKHSFELSSSSGTPSLLSSMAFILGAPTWSISSISLLCAVSSGATTCLCWTCCSLGTCVNV